MTYVQLVILLALLEFLLFGLAVGRARTRYKVPAPATGGHEVFERYFRAHMNTLEQLVVFLPSIWLFAHYINAWIAVTLGALFIIGRGLYFRATCSRPRRGTPGSPSPPSRMWRCSSAHSSA